MFDEMFDINNKVATHDLRQIVGSNKAEELMLTSRLVKTEVAERIGWQEYFGSNFHQTGQFGC
jgi:hypothetical protein